MRRKYLTRGLALSLAGAVLLSSQPASGVTAAEYYNIAVTASTADSTTLYNDGTYYYATVNMPYADFYYGELNQTTPNTSVSLDTKDPVASYRAAGQYDAVSSATDVKSTKFATTYYQTTATGVEILGLKDVQVAVPVALYDSIMENKGAAASCQNKLYEFFDAMTFSNTAFPEYKIMSGDGTFSAMTTAPNAGYSAQTVATDATASITTASVWGNYQISISGINVDSSKMQGALLQTSDGSVYGLEHLENLWLKTAEMSFAVQDFTEVHGNKVDYLRHQGLVGKTITKITYLIANGSDVVINTNLKVKKLLSDTEESMITVDDVQRNTSGMTVSFHNGLISSKSYDGAISSIIYNGAVLEKSLYSVTSTAGTITLDGSLKPGAYTAVFTDDEYEDVNATFNILSSLKAEDVTIKNNKLTISSTDATLSEYINAVTAVKVNGTSISGSNLGPILFAEDGTINFDASVTNRGNTQVFFKNGVNADYTLTIEAAGYPSIETTVGKSVQLTPLTGITLNKKSLTVAAGKTATLKTSLTPTNTTDAPSITYTSSNSSVAKVSKTGVVTGVAAGTAKITATAGSFKATCTVTVTEAYGSVKLSTSTYTYNGKNRTPAIVAKTKGGKTISSKYYTVTYPSARKAPGVYTVKVTFKGIYTGSTTRTFTIKPATATVTLNSAAKNKMKVNWKKVSGVTKYVVEYSTSPSFKNSKTVTVSSSSTSKILTKLTAYKKYYVRVCSYKTVTVNGKKRNVYSSWSKVQSLTTKKK